MRQDHIAIWSVDGKSILKHVSKDEAYLLKDELYPTGAKKYRVGSEWIHGKGRKEWLQMEPQSKDSNFISPTTLTVADAQANVGLSRKDELNHGISNGRQRAAESKLWWWPKIGDTRAACVRPA